MNGLPPAAKDRDSVIENGRNTPQFLQGEAVVLPHSRWSVRAIQEEHRLDSRAQDMNMRWPGVVRADHDAKSAMLQNVRNTPMIPEAGRLRNWSSGSTAFASIVCNAAVREVP
jgi:hypothetical protein